MRVIIILIGFLALNQYVFGQISPQNDPKTNPDLVNKIQVKQINNKSIDFYLNHRKIDKYSKMYYRGELTPSDDNITFGFLDSVMTDNKETRPFYFFVFNQIVNKADGAVAESIATMCLDFAHRFPCDFINSVKSDSLVKLDIWQGFISFSLIYGDKYVKQLDDIDRVLQKTCPKYLSDWRNIRKCISKPKNE